MTLSMFEASVPVLTKRMQVLIHLIAQGEAHASDTGTDPAKLFDARLAPDMLPFSKQVQIASDWTTRGIAELARLTPPTWANDESDLPALRDRAERTIAFLASVRADQIDGSEEREIVLPTPGRELTFAGQTYLLGFLLPNVFFHVTTAYGLLRQAGVPIGKRDFLGLA